MHYRNEIFGVEESLSPKKKRLRPVGLRFRPVDLRSSVFVFGSSLSTHPKIGAIYVITLSGKVKNTFPVKMF